MNSLKQIYVIVVWIVSAALSPSSADAASDATRNYDAFTVSVSGEGRPILLIPGMSSSASVWDDTMEALQDRYQVHVFNLAGFAGVPAAPADKVGASFLSYQKTAIQSYIADNQLRDVVVVGHSLGGFLSLWLAAEQTKNLSAVVNVDGLPALGALFAGVEQPAEADTPSAFDPAAMVKGMANNVDWHERILIDMQTSDPMTSGRAFGELMQMDIRPQLVNIDIPVLTLGAPSQGQPYSSYEQTLANYETQLGNISEEFNNRAYAETAKHFIMADEPEWLIQQIERFLDRTATQ